MRRTAQIHLYLNNEQIEKLKQLAEKENITVSKLCRDILFEANKLNKIEFLLERILKKLENAK